MAMLVPGYAARVLVSTWPGTGPGTRPDTETDVHPSLGNFPSTRFATQRQCSVILSDRSYRVIYHISVEVEIRYQQFLAFITGQETQSRFEWQNLSKGWGGTRTVWQLASGNTSFGGNQSFICIYLGLQCAASICNPLIYWLPRAAADTVTTLASGYALVISIQ